MPVVRRKRRAHPVVHRRRRRARNPVEVMAVNPRRKVYRRRKPVAHRKVYRRRRNPAELMELAANPRKRTYRRRRNPARRVYRRRYQRARGRYNPRGVPVTKRQKRQIRRYARHRYPARAVARKMGLSRAEMYKVAKFVHRKHRAWPRRRKGVKRAYSRRRRKSRTLKFRVPAGAKYGALKVAFNPAFSWEQLKTSAVAGLWGIGGFAVASFLTNTFAPKLKSGGLGLTLGAVTTDSIVATLIAAAVPFLPIHFKGKDALIAGCWVNAFARLAKDVLPTQTGITKYLPSSLGDFAQLSSYGTAPGQIATYNPGMGGTYRMPNMVAQYGPAIDAGDAGWVHDGAMNDLGYSIGPGETGHETWNDMMNEGDYDMFGNLETYGQY